jgi:hypothetical protein
MCRLIVARNRSLSNEVPGDERGAKKNMGDHLQTLARLLLASIRLANGSIALFRPQFISRQLAAAPGGHPAIHYALRMFGVRTILIGLDLLRPAGPARDHAIRVAPIIHASDTIAATLAARSGTLPARTATTIVGISAINTLLALAMQSSSSYPILRRRAE